VNPDEPTPIELARAEALVLFDWLQRLETDNTSVTDDHTVEIALWALSAALERTLVEPFQADYNTVLDEARQHLATEI
jgi:hypothetical protein